MATDYAKQYSDLKTRISSLEAQKQFWEGKKESHDANKKLLMDEAAALGIKSGDLTIVKETLEKQISEEMAALEISVSAAEKQFINLRSQNVNAET